MFPTIWTLIKIVHDNFCFLAPFLFTLKIIYYGDETVLTFYFKLVLSLLGSCECRINSPRLYTDVAVWGGMSCQWCDLFKFMYFLSKWFRSLMPDCETAISVQFILNIFNPPLLDFFSIPSYLVNFFQLVAQTRFFRDSDASVDQVFSCILQL